MDICKSIAFTDLCLACFGWRRFGYSMTAFSSSKPPVVSTVAASWCLWTASISDHTLPLLVMNCICANVFLFFSTLWTIPKISC